jgi:DNA-binding SARP family transcriptional activator
LLVVDSNGTIVSRNLQAARLIEARSPAAERLTCCELLRCRDPDTVLANTCVTEAALEHKVAIPEVRVDIDTTTGIKAFWVAAAPIRESDETSRVVLQLRPGDIHDRRRRTDPHWMSGPTLRIRAFGRLTVESAEGQIGGGWLDQRTGQLLRYLVAERHRSVHVDEIGESIWTDADFAIANSVRYYIHTLRRKIEPQRDKRAPSAFISSRAGSYRLNLERVTVDADEFEAHISAGLAAAETDKELAAAELEQGLTLYRGDFLADVPYADWAMPERHRLHDMACIALRALADISLSTRMPTVAIRHLEWLATMQPYDERVHRELMELDIARGRRSDAVRRYNILRSRIRRTFGHDLDFTPADLAAPKPYRDPQGA